jgi:hypothetical protein
MRRSTVGGHRIGGSASNDVDRGAELAARQRVEFWCGRDHSTMTVLAAEAETPEVWDCEVCGAPAVRMRGDAPPPARQSTFHRTHYEFLMMRRTPEDGEKLLAEALENLARTRAAAAARP